MKLADVLQRKGAQAVTIAESASVADGIKAMYENKVGSVLITDEAESGNLLGIFTERDVFHLCADGKGGQLEQLPIKQCMTSNVVVGKPDDPVDDTLTVMTQKRFRRMPVVVEGRIVGLLSIGDLVKAKLEETAVEAEELRKYIAS